MKTETLTPVYNDTKQGAVKMTRLESKAVLLIENKQGHAGRKRAAQLELALRVVAAMYRNEMSEMGNVGTDELVDTLKGLIRDVTGAAFGTTISL